MPSLSRYQTPSSLLDALRESVGKRLSPEELSEQRVSFVYGSLDSESNVTKEEVRKIISNQGGVAA